MVSFSLRQRIILPPPPGPTPVSFHLSQFEVREYMRKAFTIMNRSYRFAARSALFRYPLERILPLCVRK
jgi:hypothetical protein